MDVGPSTITGGSNGDRPRLIVHIDLDCFYAQVEMLRVDHPRDVPFVVKQWGGIIAINYVAKARGVTRLKHTFDDARNICPDLKWEHVATYAPGSETWAYHPDSTVRKSTHKVSLEPYRLASQRIFEVLQGWQKREGIAVEKGGIDEAFLDVTALVDRRYEQLLQERLDTSSGALSRDAATTHLAEEWAHRAQEISKFLDPYAAAAKAPAAVPEAEEDEGNEHDLNTGITIPAETSACVALPPPPPPPERTMDSDETRLRFFLACEFVHDIRRELKVDLGYEASAGVAHTRSIAKIISATHKPNQQTLLLPGDAKAFLFTLPFTKLRGYGGKLGHHIAKHFQADTCGALWNVPASAFAPLLGGSMDDAEELFRRIRGHGNDTITTERIAPKSMLSHKAFAPATRDESVIQGWLQVLSGELVRRMSTVFAEFQLRPTRMNIKAGERGLGSMDLLNKTLPLPWPPTAVAMTRMALQAVMLMVRNTQPSPQINSLMLGATVLRPDPGVALNSEGEFVVANGNGRQAQLDRFWATGHIKQETASPPPPGRRRSIALGAKATVPSRPPQPPPGETIEIDDEEEQEVCCETPRREADVVVLSSSSDGSL